MKLDIPFISQLNNSTRNDCGAACLASLVGLPLDDLLARIKHPPNAPLSVQNIQDGLRHFGLHGKYTRPLTLPAIREALAERQPVICLVHYGVLPEAVRLTDFRGAHWVLITGQDETDFFVHDPLSPAEGHRRWPAAALDDALRSRNTSNLPQQGVIVARAFPVANENVLAFHNLAQQVRQSAHELRQELAIREHYLMQLYEALEIEGSGPEAQGHALSAILRLKLAQQNC